MSQPNHRSAAPRRWLSSLLAAVLAGTFLVAGGIDAYGLHECPHHDALPPAVGGPATAHSTQAGAHAAHASAAVPADDHADHGPCNCIGMCGAATIALPAIAGAHVRIAAATDLHIGDTQARSLLSTPRDYLLPFATAPPHVG